MIVAIEVFAMCAIAVITLWLFMISVAPSPAFDLLDLIKFSVRPTKKHQQSPEPRHICPGFPLGLTDDELRLVSQINTVAHENRMAQILDSWFECQAYARLNRRRYHHLKWADLTTAQRIEIIHASAIHMGAINHPKRKERS